MSSSGSVSQWIAQLKAGERGAVQALWENYFRRLVARARKRLGAIPRRAADEEDVALSAFASFCRAAEQGRFPKLYDRDDLWQLLMVITDRKACHLANYERRERRGGGKVLDEAALPKGESEAGSLARLESPEPTPEYAAQAAEECRRLLAMLGDADLQRVALRRMEGSTVEEIAAEFDRVPRTVRRWLQVIRRTWEQELGQ
jgi:DNA-directed RNA polymerase specialized sigma24 family protein